MHKLIPAERIENKIYLIRSQKVMLDRDLASLYEVDAIRLREQVKRNIRRFPSDFMFRLSSTEVAVMVSQNAIPSRRQLGGHLPFVFTEHGILMLSSILRSQRAIDVNIQIMRTFTKLRKMLINFRGLREKVEEMEKKYDKQFKVVFDAIRELIMPPAKPPLKIGFLRDREQIHNSSFNITEFSNIKNQSGSKRSK